MNNWPLVLPHAQVKRMLQRHASRLILTSRVRPGSYDVQDSLIVRRNERKRRTGRFSEQEAPTAFAIAITQIRELALGELDLRVVRGAGFRTQRDFYDDWLWRRRSIDPGQRVQVCAFVFVAPERYLHRRVHRGYTTDPAHAASGEPSALSQAELSELAVAAALRLERERREEVRRAKARSLSASVRRAILEGDLVAVRAIRAELDELLDSSRLDVRTIRASPLSGANSPAVDSRHSGSALKFGTRLLGRTIPDGGLGGAEWLSRLTRT